MSDITIPPAALEAAARAMWKTDDPSQWEIGMARIACLAMLKAWPGMEQRTSGHHPRGIGGPGEVVTRRIILPLPQEGE